MSTAQPPPDQPVRFDQGIGEIPPRPPRRKRRWWLVALAIVLPVLLLGGCIAALLNTPGVSPGTGPAASAEPAPTTVVEPGEPDFTEPAPEPTETETKPPAVANFKQKYTYEDGLIVEVTAIKHGKISRAEAEYSDEIKVNDPWTKFTIRVTNKSAEALDLWADTNVSYGPDGTGAEPISGYYFKPEIDDDLSGTLIPGKSRSTTVAFKIPPNWRKDVVLEFAVTFDHESAVFSGSTL